MKELRWLREETKSHAVLFFVYHILNFVFS